jgi:cohesin complex subunit SA-1/2
MLTDPPSESEDEDDEEEVPARRKRSPPKAKTPAQSRKRKLGTPRRASSGAATSRKSAQTALSTLAKKVLDPTEDKETSLFAALLNCLADQGDKKKTKRANVEKDTLYSAQLGNIARQLVEQHESDPNKAQIDLLNLIFRSIGGSMEVLLSASTTDLENLSNEEWEDTFTNLTSAMQLTPNDQILLRADPLGSHATVGIREYRKMYREFWYILGGVILSNNSGTAPKNDDDSDDEEEEEEPEALATSRFQIETSREVLLRVVEISGVGQPDIRAAACIAIYQLSTAMLERTLELKAKLQVANRQLAVAKRNKSTVKAKALKDQVSSWKRTIAELEAMVNDHVMNDSVFNRKYRDGNEHIRADSLEALSRFTTLRPDLYLNSKYLKYFGWMLSDKQAIVRRQAVSGLLTPFQQKAPRSLANRASSPKIDLKSAMNAVFERFMKRLTDTVLDVDNVVQEKAMALLLCLLKEGFLDELEDNSIWDQINTRALATNTTMTARRDALYFVMEQLDAFDSGATKNESVMVERIDGLSKW